MDLARVGGRLRAGAGLALLLLVAGCAGLRAGEPLRPMALAARASEFHCEHGRWPEGPAELEAFVPPDPSRIRPAPSREPLPWSLLAGAEFVVESDGALRIAAGLPAGSVAEGPAKDPVDLQLRVQVPGCWPPARGSGP